MLCNVIFSLFIWGEWKLNLITRAVSSDMSENHWGRVSHIISRSVMGKLQPPGNIQSVVLFE